MGSFPAHLHLTETIPVADHTVVAVGVGVGGQYLVVEVPDEHGRCWICAPISDRALQCVREARASAWTAVHHSVTGTAEIYRESVDGSMHESVVLCSELPDCRPALIAA